MTHSPTILPKIRLEKTAPLRCAIQDLTTTHILYSVVALEVLFNQVAFTDVISPCDSCINTHHRHKVLGPVLQLILPPQTCDSPSHSCGSLVSIYLPVKKTNNLLVYNCKSI